MGAGSVTYAITGDFSATGELPFVRESSSVDQAGTTSLVFCSRSCTYQDASAFLLFELGAEGGEVRFDDGDVLLLYVACDFTFTRQDEIDVAGQFSCPPEQGFGPGADGMCAWTDRMQGTTWVSRTDGCAPIGTAGISGSFDTGGF
jgi:hypothetical protein